MPHQDERVKATAKAGKHQTSGRMNVIYRDAKGISREATVVGPGTGSGLKLRVGSLSILGPTVGTIDNVAKATTAKQTGVYFSRGRV